MRAALGPGKLSAVPAAAAVNQSVVTSPEAKTSRLLPEQEQILLRFFGAQDKVDREEALALANQVSFCIMCTVAFRSRYKDLTSLHAHFKW